MIEKLDSVLEKITFLSDRQEILEATLVVSKTSNEKVLNRVISLGREFAHSQPIQ